MSKNQDSRPESPGPTIEGRSVGLPPAAPPPPGLDVPALAKVVDVGLIEAVPAPVFAKEPVSDHRADGPVKIAMPESRPSDAAMTSPATVDVTLDPTDPGSQVESRIYGPVPPNRPAA